MELLQFCWTKLIMEYLAGQPNLQQRSDKYGQY